MEGRHFAVIISILVWITGYLFSLYFFSYKFSHGIIPKKLRIKTNNKVMLFYLLGSMIISPFIAGMSYRIGGIMERGNGIAWGCYIEDYWLCILLWLGSFFITSIFLLISLINPTLLKFKKRINAFALYGLHNIYTLILLIVIGILIPILSGPLSGKGSTCW